MFAFSGIDWGINKNINPCKYAYFIVNHIRLNASGIFGNGNKYNGSGGGR